MNPAREVLVGGAVVVGRWRHRRSRLVEGVAALADPGAEVIDASRLRRHAGHDQRPPAPDRRSAGAQLHPRPAPARCVDLRVVGAAARRPHAGRRRAGGRRCRAVECVQQRGHDRRRGGHGRPPGAGRRRRSSAVGLRGTIGTWGWDIEEGPFAAPADEVLDRQRAVVERYPAGGLVEGWVTLVGHDLASDALLAGAADLARELRHRDDDAPLAHVVGSRALPRPDGRRPVVHLDAPRRARTAPAAGPRGVARRRGGRARPGERHGDRLLPVGVPPARPGGTRDGRHAEIVERGGRVALGCDASNAGDAADILRAAAAAAGIARDARIDPDALRRPRRPSSWPRSPVPKPIGMADQIGSIEPGKQADLVVHRADGLGLDAARRRRAAARCGAPTVAVGP